MDQEKKAAGFWTKRRMLLIPMGIAAAVPLIPGIVGAWFSWGGFDPVVNLGNGDSMSIAVEMQRIVGCHADEDVDIRVRLPEGYKGAKVVSESSLTYDCFDLPSNTLTTKTRLVKVGGDNGNDNRGDNNDGSRHDNAANVAVRIHSTETGPVCVVVKVGKTSKVGSPSFQGVQSGSCPVPPPTKGVTVTTIQGTSDKPVTGWVKLG